MAAGLPSGSVEYSRLESPVAIQFTCVHFTRVTECPHLHVIEGERKQSRFNTT